MSVELYPDHKAILHFHDSLKVFQIDFLDYLTAFLAREEYSERHFDLYVRPTLLYSAFDFIVVEPKQAIYILQTPENKKDFLLGKEQLEFFTHRRLEMLSPSLHKRMTQTSPSQRAEMQACLIQPFFTYMTKHYWDRFRVRMRKIFCL